MEMPIIQKTVASGIHKAQMSQNKVAAYLVRSIQAGLYLSLVCFLFWCLLNDLASSPFGRVTASLFFGVGLFVIVATGAELFTSNTMYLATSSLAGRTTWVETARLWGLCYFGNLIGALAFALLLLGAGVLDDMPLTHALYRGAAHKVEQASSVIFFKGILANWVVCLAVWVGLHMKQDTARLFAIVLIISIFLYLGFEHSIANMGTFAIVLLGHGTISLEAMGHNLLWATLGNIVGGGFFIGALYWYLNKDEAAETQV